jgi:hypothetical protein
VHINVYRAVINQNDVLPKMNMPCLQYAGDGDEGPFQNAPGAAQKMPNAHCFSLPGLNHVGASGAVELVLPELRSFLQFKRG